MDAPGSDVSLGEFTEVGGTLGAFSNSSLSGLFGLNSISPTSTISLNESGQGTLDGNGTLATSFGLTVDISSTTGLLPNQPFMGMYSVSANGRVTVTLTSGQPLVFWILLPAIPGVFNGQFVGISTVMTGDTNPVLLEFLQ